MADGMFSSGAEGVLDFVKLIPDGRPPKRADRAAAGQLPGRAMRYCDALTSATGFGYWVFPPVDLQLLWDGEEIVWSYDDAAAWMPLSATSSGAVQFPGFASQFNEHAPEELRDYSPPFLTALPEPGMVQIWTGLLARTRPGWSVQLRQPVNLPAPSGLSAWEGIVETDEWFGPLFSVFRITKTDYPVRLRSQVPFLQVQPIPQAAYRDGLLNDLSVRTMDDMTADDWSDYGSAVKPDFDAKARAGSYAVRVRKRRTCPYHEQQVKNAVSVG